MDFVLLLILAFYFVRGCLKGFVSTLFSLVGTFVVALISLQLMHQFLPIAESYCGDFVKETLGGLFDGLVKGNFANIDDLEIALSATKFGTLFSFFISKLIGNISFDGTLTAGQILAPTISTILIKVVLFLIIFVVFEILLKILRLFLNKIIKKCGFSVGNRILGGVLGLLKGIFVFGIVFFSLSMLSNIILSEGLLQFVRSGQISNLLYENLLSKIVGLFY